MTTAVKVTVIEPPGGFRVICPKCGGKPAEPSVVFMNTGEDYTKHRQEMRVMPCGVCDGSGQATPEQAHRYWEGRRMRDERIARGETLGEAAERMGLTPAQLSAIEHGRQPSNDEVKPRPHGA